MSDKITELLATNDPATADLAVRSRREFLLSLGKWSKAVIGGALLGGALLPDQDAQAWGGGPAGGAGLWYNSGNGWGGWVQQPWGWYNGPRWQSQPYWGNRPNWNNGGWYDRPWNNRPWNNGGWYDGWYNR